MGGMNPIALIKALIGNSGSQGNQSTNSTCCSPFAGMKGKQCPCPPGCGQGCNCCA